MEQSYPFIKDRPIVCVQGLGFVGSAMAVAVANVIDGNGRPFYNVIGIDLPIPTGFRQIEELNKGRFPFSTQDPNLQEALKKARKRKNFWATSDQSFYSLASTVIVDINLDVQEIQRNPKIDFTSFIGGIRGIGSFIKPGTLVIVETTVPPGTCEKVVAPMLNEEFAKRNFGPGSFMLAHSFERVMPGIDYYKSITDFWRVYAGHTDDAAEACKSFLSSIINTVEYPLTRLMSTTASETAKVLENSYRAVNIAFIEEWSRFAEATGIDLFEIIDAIRVRPTHSNIRQPGFGVGGYCLTKDPLMGSIAAQSLFDIQGLEFPFSTMAISTNAKMPLASLAMAEEMLGGNVNEKSILLMGVSYRQDVGDTRHSPSETFVKKAIHDGAKVVCQDPLVSYWPELSMEVLTDIPNPNEFDIIVFAVPHRDYLMINFDNWLVSISPRVLDANNVLDVQQREWLIRRGIAFRAIGRGNIA